MQTPLGARVIPVRHQTDLDDVVRDVLGWDLVGLDTETALLSPARRDEQGNLLKDRLDFHNMALRAVQLGNVDRVYVIDCATVTDLEPLRPILEGKQVKLAHNAKFEFKMLDRYGFDTRNLACTMRAEDVLFQGLSEKKASLAELALKYLGLEMDKGTRDTFIEERAVAPLTDDQVRYSASDVDLLLPIYLAQKSELESAGLWDVARFEWKVQRAFARIELRGFLLDREKWSALLARTEADRDRTLEELQALFRPAAIRRWEALFAQHPEWGTKKDPARPLKSKVWDFDKVLNSPAQLKQAFLQLGLDLEDTNERTLMREKRDLLDLQSSGRAIPEDALRGIDLLIRYRELYTRCSRYGQNWLDLVSPVTGRIHAEYDELKSTARTGCGNPNVQNIPKRDEGAKEYRKCFVAPPGRLLIPVDYSQVELRMAAELSGDRNMIDAFLSGLDLHRATAALMFGKEPDTVTKDERIAAKCVNFGILFGIGAGKLSEQITNTPGALPCSQREARKYLAMYGKAYPRLMAWLEREGKAARANFEGYTLMGHRRRWHQPARPDGALQRTDPAEWKRLCDEFTGRLASIEREGKNLPIQGTCACIAKIAILELERTLPIYDAGIVAFVHDELVVEAPAREAERVAALVKETMERAGHRFFKQVPCVADPSIGSNWYAED